MFRLPERTISCLYTDGIQEAINKDEVQFGTDRMLEAFNDAQNYGHEK